MKQTPSHTVGPFFAYGLTPEQYQYNFKSIFSNVLISNIENIIIKGTIFDGEGMAIPDAMVEIWDSQNNLFGRYGSGTETDNNFIFTTKKPTPINHNAPFLTVIIFMRGQMIHSYTRIYFDDEANDLDEILLQVPEERRQTLIAKKSKGYYLFDIHMQGENETVFFDI